MNDIEYLNTIAKDNRTEIAPAKDHILDPKWIKIIIGAVAAVIVMMIIGGILSGLGNGERDLLDKIYARTNNLNTSINNYSDSLKSSDLRSMASSLSTVLRETNAKVGAILTSDYGDTTPKDESITSEETDHIAAVDSALNYGKINGLLDRYFAHEMSREIVLLQSLESEALEKSDGDAIKSALSSSWNNLEKLKPQFEDFQAL
ncbi:hypothetical protein IJN73_01880 [Candidatus Saccharibacteria bacterium]|nr:hypothetical protein [Candidatus Saccharibacteria bacterium]